MELFPKARSARAELFVKAILTELHEECGQCSGSHGRRRQESSLRVMKGAFLRRPRMLWYSVITRSRIHPRDATGNTNDHCSLSCCVEGYNVISWHTMPYRSVPCCMHMYLHSLFCVFLNIKARAMTRNSCSNVVSPLRF